MAAAEQTYDTALSSPDDEKKFQLWKQKYAPNDSGADYDLRGAFKAGVNPDSERGHFPDTFKKPNHPTFSTESQYSKGDSVGGQWVERNGKSVFIPSPWNLKQTTPDKLRDYFKRIEPDATLDLPESPTLPLSMIAPIPPPGGSLDIDLQYLRQLQ